MHRRRIDPCGPVGQRRIAVARVFCGFDKPRHLTQAGVFSDGRSGQVKRRAQIDFAGPQSCAFGGMHRIAFPG